MYKLIVALFALFATAAAYNLPAGPSIGRVAAQAPLAVRTPVFAQQAARAALVMNEDGEEETDYEMFDPIYYAVCIVPMSIALLKSGGLF